ncbi:hypothetical protein L6164_003637 [Bauhinia variegata]|uniref:Uncharacterized protein n=2 Tax=Bauhinia variegata TaxID=167791 RepID=A0ACB9Q7E1_BAUVA|nr:hypothetical protein L6164_003634 [Bauhinia variegata]KAI4354800.1 hypothetical protein L6164_003637 [Bauhinia variegata]
MSSSQQLCLFLLSKCRSLKLAKQIHAYVDKNGLYTDPLVAGKLHLLCAVSISDALHYARCLLLQFPNPDAFMYNTLIRELAESETPSDSLHTFVKMRQQSIVLPDGFSFAFTLKVVANCRFLRAGLQLHGQALCHGLDSHIFVGTTLISMYMECGNVHSARQVFEEMSDPTLSYGMQLSLRLLGKLESARQAFFEMPLKDDVSWSTMIVGFAHNGLFNEAFGFFRQLQRERIRPNEVSLTGVLSACAQAGAFEFGKILHGFIQKSGFLQIVSMSNALMDTYSRCGNVVMARLVFQNMLVGRNVVSWTSMIAGLAMHGHGEKTIELFHEMEECGVTPDGITFISLLYDCSHAGLVEQGCAYFSKMKNVYGIEPAIEQK